MAAEGFRLHGKLAYKCSGLACSRYWICESDPPSDADIKRAARDKWFKTVIGWFCSDYCLSNATGPSVIGKGSRSNATES